MADSNHVINGNRNVKVAGNHKLTVGTSLVVSVGGSAARRAKRGPMAAISAKTRVRAPKTAECRQCVRPLASGGN